MDADKLQRGQKYRIKADVAMKVCPRPMTYTGRELYRGVYYHAFWDKVLRLGHWIDPAEVEPA